jgi:hypothetical protein
VRRVIHAYEEHALPAFSIAPSKFRSCQVVGHSGSDQPCRVDTACHLPETRGQQAARGLGQVSAGANGDLPPLRSSPPRPLEEAVYGFSQPKWITVAPAQPDLLDIPESVVGR